MQRKSAAAKAVSWVPKGSAGAEAPKGAEDDGAAESPILNAPSTGPSYDKLEMLRFFQAVGGMEGAEKALDVAVAERPADDADGGKTPGARRALREQKKAEKASKRALSGLMDDTIDEDVSAAPILDTPTGASATQVSLASAMGKANSTEAAAAAYAQYNAAMMQYLNSMYVSSANMQAYAGYTTVMLRNIPNRYSRDMLVERLNQSYQGQFDFVYLPIDFNSKCNVGYAFINFRTPAVAGMFVQEFHGKKTKSVLPGFTSAKVCEVSYARVQGRDANMDNLRDEKFIEKLNERPEWQPLFYDNAGKELSFKDLMAAGKKKGGKTAVPATPPGYMGGYSPFGMMYPPGAYATPPPPPKEPTVPAVTLSTALPSATAETMIMVKDVPADVTQDKALELLNKSVKGQYDFFFIPKDPKEEKNRGFFFVNFLKKEKADEFTKEYTSKKVSEVYGTPANESDKVCEALPARLSSLEGSIARTQSTVLKVPEATRAAWSPVIFKEDGSTSPFPQISKPENGKGGKDVGKDARHDHGKAAEVEDGEDFVGKGKKGKGEGKGKKGAGKGKNPYGGYSYADPRMMAMYGGYGMPGYGMPGTPSASQAAYMAHAMAMQGAMMQQMGAPRGGGGPGSVLAPLAAAVNGSPKLTGEVKTNLRKQVEFYFSVDNLCKDVYLRKHMSPETGYTNLSMIADFPKVKNYRASAAELVEVLAKSKKVELDATKKLIRLKDEVERKRWAQPSRPAADAAEKPAESSEEKATPP